MDILRLILDWAELRQVAGLDAVAYAAFALIGTVLFVIRVGMMLIGGMDTDFATDLADHGSGFSVVSLMSITAFFIGAGWSGLAAQLEWGLGSGVTAIVAGLCGVALMFASAGVMFGAKKLGREVTYELQSAVGKTASVYITIPASGGGKGQVRIVVSGRSMVIDAVSTGPKLEAFSEVRVTAARDDKTLVVEALSAATA